MNIKLSWSIKLKEHLFQTGNIRRIIANMISFARQYLLDYTVFSDGKLPGIEIICTLYIAKNMKPEH